MRCPFCKRSDTKVVDSRVAGDALRRRRECLKCAKRFTTYERVENAAFLVVKKDGRREPFSREKLRLGIAHACEKLPISDADLRAEYDKLPADKKIGGVNGQEIVLRVAKPEFEAKVQEKASELITRLKKDGDVVSEATLAATKTTATSKKSAA